MEEGEEREEKEKWKEEGYEITSTKDAVVGTVEKKLGKYIKKHLGVTADKVYAKALDGLNPYDVTVRMENGKLIMGMLGYMAEIPMTGENFMAVAEMAFESMFSWLDAFWEMMENNIPVPDPRRQVVNNLEIVKRELEEQKQRMENLEDVTFVCK